MDVKEAIRYRQKRSLDILGIPENYWINLHQNNLKFFLSTYPNTAIDPLPTDLQPPVEYLLLSNWLQTAKATATKLGDWHEEDVVTIASEAAGEITGCCFTDNSEASGIILDNAMISFFPLVSNIATQLLLTTEKENITPNFSQTSLSSKAKSIHGPSESFHRLFTSYVENGDTSTADKNPLSKDYYAAGIKLCEGMGLFVVGHELGHIHLRHTRDPWMKENDLERQVDDKMTVFSYRHRKEVEADGYGFNIVINSTDLADPLDRLKILGPFLLLIALDALERHIFFGLFGRDRWKNPEDIWGHIAGSFSFPSHHPPPFARWGLLKNRILSSNLPAWLKKDLSDFSLNMQGAMLDMERASQNRLIARGYPMRVHRKWRVDGPEFVGLSKKGQAWVDGFEK